MGLHLSFLMGVGIFLLGAVFGRFLRMRIRAIERMPKKQGVALGGCIIELLTGGLFWFVYYYVDGPQMWGLWVLICFFIPIILIDLKHKIIPDALNFLGITAVFMLGIFLPEAFGEKNVVILLKKQVAGLLIGSGIVLWIAIIGEYFLKKECMGFGDVKLMGLIGAATGWEGSVFALLVGAVLGCIVGVPWLLYLKFTKSVKISNYEIPFGPFLCAAALVYMLFARTVIAEYFFIVASIFGTF